MPARRTSSRITWRVGWAFQPIFFSLAPNDRPGRVAGHEEGGDAARARLAGARHDDVDGCLAGARDELLDAGQHVVVAVADRAGRDGRGIGSGARLGEAVAPKSVIAVSRGSHAWRCCFGAVRVDHPRDHVVDRDVGGDRGSPFASSSKIATVSERLRPDAADVLAHVDAAEPELAGQRSASRGKVLLLIPLQRVRRELGLGEVADGLDDGRALSSDVVVRQGHRHGAPPVAPAQRSWPLRGQCDPPANSLAPCTLAGLA